MRNKDNYSCLKDDLHKAYESLNWHFLLAVIDKMHFPHCWMRWLAQLLSKFFLLVSLVVFFIVLMAYDKETLWLLLFFVLAMEGMSHMMHHKIDKGLIKPISFNGVSIYYIFLCVDLLIFSSINANSVSSIKGVLDQFATYSGKKLNPIMSQFFSNLDNTHVIESFLNIKQASFPIRYLGLPLFFGRITKAMCNPIDKVKIKLDGWKEHVLSQEGIVKLIRSMCISLTLFWSECFPIPKSIHHEIGMLIRKFF